MLTNILRRLSLDGSTKQPPLPAPESAILWSRAGREMTPLAPAGMEFNIEDAAHALSVMPRFAGHTNEFYSVAEHSVWCSRHAPPALAMHALLRDLPKAYLMDMPGPIRRAMPSYCAAESRLRYHALLSHGYDPHLSAATILDAVDDSALLTEWRDLKDDAGMAWWGIDPSAVAPFSPIRPVGHERARALFMDRFSELSSGALRKSELHRVEASIERLQGWRLPTRPEIITASSRIIDLVGEAPPARFDLSDIATALSRMPRYAGHTRQPYSVAQHSLMVASLVPEEHRAQALLHDASEAYLMDMPSPIKAHFPEYREMEARAEDQIYASFGLANWKAFKSTIKAADRLALDAECRDLMLHAGHGSDFPMAEGIPEIKVMPAAEAASAWLEATQDALRCAPRERHSSLAMARM